MTCLELEKNGTVIKVNVDRYGDGCSFHTYKYDALCERKDIDFAEKRNICIQQQAEKEEKENAERKKRKRHGNHLSNRLAYEVS